MPDALKAIYRNGAFILQTACDLPEGLRLNCLFNHLKLCRLQFLMQKLSNVF